jgi:hypothetical protein
VGFTVTPQANHRSTYAYFTSDFGDAGNLIIAIGRGHFDCKRGYFIYELISSALLDKVASSPSTAVCKSGNFITASQTR